MASFVERVSDKVDEILNSVVVPSGDDSATPAQTAPAEGVSRGVKPHISGSWTDVSSSDVSRYVKNLETGLKGTSTNVHQYLKIIAFLMKNLFPTEEVFITDGFRSPERQVREMVSNWKANGGDAPLKEPIRKRVRGLGVVNIKTAGTKYLVDLYKDDKMAYVFGTQLENGTFDAERWAKFFSSSGGAHSRGIAVDFRSRGKSFMSQLLDESRKYANIHVVNETGHARPHWHVEVHGIRSAPPKAVAFKEFPLSKKAFQITVQPYDHLVQEALQSMQSKLGADYFSYTDKSGKKVVIDKIVLEAGDPGHFGMVRSDNPSTIYLSLDKIKKAITGVSQDEAEDIIQKAIIEVLSHEKGHLDANFEGGEAPAEQESHKIMPRFSYQGRSKLLVALNMIGEHELAKQAYVNPNVKPNDVAQSILRLIYHFVQKVKPEGQQKYVQNIGRKLMQTDVMEMASRRKNPGAGVGGINSMVKHILAGEDPSVISSVIQKVVEGLQKM